MTLRELSLLFPRRTLSAEEADSLMAEPIRI